MMRKKNIVAITSIVLASLAFVSPAWAKSMVSHGQTANVAYAGSLQLVMDQQVGPSFAKKTGDTYQGRGGGSFGVAHLIASKEITPNVMISMGYAPIQSLEPTFTSYGIGFASSPLVIAYSASSPFAKSLNLIKEHKKTLRALFTLMEKTNFHLGRTNPVTDPQGQAFLWMVQLATKVWHLPANTVTKITGSVENPKQIFSEESILSLLQAGQLDASSAFLSEAIARHLDYIALPGSINMGDPTFQKQYETAMVKLPSGKVVHGTSLNLVITTLHGEPDPSAGVAFMNDVLSPLGKAAFAKEGFRLIKPIIYGNRTAIPTSTRSLLAR